MDRGRELDHLARLGLHDGTIGRGRGRSPGVRSRPGRGMAEKARRDQALRRDRQTAQSPADEPRDIDGLRERPPQIQTAQRTAVSVEDDEVGRQARTFAVSRSEARIVPKRLGVGGKKVHRKRQSTGKKVVAGFFGRDAEPENGALAARIALAPVMLVALELQAPSGLEGDDPERPGSDGSVFPARPDLARALGNDRGRRERNHGREERDRLLEVRVELGRRYDVKPFEIGCSALDQPFGSLDGGQEKPAAALFVEQEPLE